MGNSYTTPALGSRRQEEEPNGSDIISVIERVAKRQEYEYKQSDMQSDLRDIENDIQKYVGIEGKKTLNKKLKESSGESFLHTAIRKLQFKESQILEGEEDKISSHHYQIVAISSHHYQIVAKLILNLRKLVLAARHRTESLNYDGQTPLHMAITKGNIRLTRMLLMAVHKDLKPENEELLLRESQSEASHFGYSDNTPNLDIEQYNVNSKNLEKMMKSRAVGSIFDKTVMMAQIPLSVAALSLNKQIFDLLLKYGAKLDGKNQHGNNVCHSLITYSHFYPEKTEKVIDMLEYIVKEEPYSIERQHQSIERNKLRKKLWRMENSEGMNPLQLAAKLGQDKIFKFIMGLESYCHGNDNDGIFDLLEYDITEIDAITATSREKSEINGERIVNIATQESHQHKAIRKKSVLELIMEIDPLKASSFIEFAPVGIIIEEKWKAYQTMFYPVWIVHMVFVVFLTWYATDRAMIIPAENYTVDSQAEFKYTVQNGQARAIVPQILALLFAVVYIVQEIVRLKLKRMPWSSRQITSPYGNGVFRILFVLFALCLIVDFLFTWVAAYENYLLIVAVVVGWFLVLFFLRTCRRFSFFTVLIQKVIFGDLFRFSVVLSLMLVAFNTAMFIVFQGSSATDGEFDTFFRTLKTMFEIMLGIGEINILFSARQPVFAILIYFCFVLLTTLLLLNALIAMMSNTCMEIVRHVDGINMKDVHWRLQQLSAILFLESILPEVWVNRPGKRFDDIEDYSNKSKRREQCTRYMLEMRSRIELDSSEEQTEDHQSVFARLSKFLQKYPEDAPVEDAPMTASTLNSKWSGRGGKGYTLPGPVVPHTHNKRTIDINHIFDNVVFHVESFEDCT